MKHALTTAVILAASLAAAPFAFAQTPAPAIPSAKAAPTPAASVPKAAAPQSQLVNLNTAPAADLDKLPQIGEARSKAIIAKRPYKNWDDFVAKKVVPANAEAAIKGKVKF